MQGLKVLVIIVKRLQGLMKLLTNGHRQAWTENQTPISNDASRCDKK